MMKKIQEILDKISKEQDIKILFACESGSRAWGFPSSDSDYDVRFVYYSPLKSYLSIDEVQDTVTIPIADELDVVGWDIKKFLKHIRKSTGSVFEWLHSPIFYRSEINSLNELREISKEYFSKRTMMHHYLGISKNAYKSLNDGQIGIKKLLYVLRPLLAALWICEKQTIPPVDFNDLLPLINDKPVVNKINELLKQKSNSAERFTVELDSNIKNYIDTIFNYCDRKVADFKRKTNTSEKLDDFFTKLIFKHKRV